MSYLNKNLEGRRRVQKNVTGTLDLLELQNSFVPGVPLYNNINNKLKRLIAGSNISLLDTTESVTINSNTSGVTEIETIGTNSESILVNNPSVGPIINLKGVTGMNLNTEVTFTTNNNNIEVDVIKARPLKSGVVPGNIDEGIGFTGGKCIIGYNNNSTTGNNLCSIGNQSFVSSNNKGNITAIGNNIHTLGDQASNSVILGNQNFQNGAEFSLNSVAGYSNYRDAPFTSSVNSSSILCNEFCQRLLLTPTDVHGQNNIIGQQIMNDSFPSGGGYTGPAEMKTNIIIGNEIYFNEGDKTNYNNNIILGNKLNTNISDCIIIKPGSTGYYESLSSGVFYMGKGDNQPSENNSLVISNNYEKYKIYDIPGPFTSTLYLNYSLTAPGIDSASSPPLYPNPLTTTFKRISKSPDLKPEVTLSYNMIASSGIDRKLVAEHSFITEHNVPYVTSFNGGNWGIKINCRSTSSVQNFVQAVFYKYFIDGTMIELFQTNPQVITNSVFAYQTTFFNSAPILTFGRTNRIAIRIFVLSTLESPSTVEFKFEGENSFATVFIPDPINPFIYDTDYLLHYDEINGEITKKIITNTINSSASKKVLKRDNEQSIRFRTFLGASGINITELPDELEFSVDSSILPIDMEPTVSGLAYGKQDDTLLFTGLGKDIKSDNNDSLVIYNQSIDNLSQIVPIQSSIVLENSSDTSNLDSINNSSTILNNYISNIGDKFNSSYINISGQFEQPSEINNSIVIGTVDNFRAAGNMDNSITIRPYNAGGLRVQQASNSCLIGPGSSNRSIGTAEFWIDGYADYYITGVDTNITSDVLYYDPISSRITYGAGYTYSLPAKLPGTLGGSYGYNNSGNASEITGRNSFVNYTTGVNLSGISAVGNNNFTSNVSTTFSDSMVLGSTIRFNNLLNMTNSLFATNIINNSGVTSIANNAIIMPKASSLSISGGITSITGACFLTSSNISLTNADPNYSVVVGSGSTVNPGSNNMVMISGGLNSNITMQGQGNMLFQASGSSTNYTSAAFNNSVIFNSGSSTVAASANLQFCACHTTLKMPNLNTVSSVTSANTRIMGWDATTGLISPYLSTDLSRVYRSQANTNASGIVVFNTGSIVANTAGNTYNANVVNASTTNAYICQIQSTTATTVTIQVFVSQTILLGGQPVTTAPSNIVVSFSMNY